MTTDPQPPDAPDQGPEVIDARGLKCPLPVIRLAARAKVLPPGTELAVLTTDPAARPDIAAWCRMRNHDLLSQDPSENDALRHAIRLR